LLNGAEVPSGDPYRRSVQLDLFPASMIERVDITKTYTPDQPGGTGGSTINVVTKSFPPEPFIKTTSASRTIRSQNLRNDFLADPRTDMSDVRVAETARSAVRAALCFDHQAGLPSQAPLRETPGQRG
jgi:hypothetical protein